MRPRWKRQYENTYSLQDNGPAGKVSMFLLVGTQKALLIDSGYGLLDLQSVILEITDKPITLVNTHGHFDHAGGSWQFEKVYLRTEDYDVYREHSAVEFLKRSYANKKVRPEVQERLDAAIAAGPANVLPLDNISSFDLGRRIVTVVHMPGHTKGSVCLLDEDNNAAFTGDNLCRSIWLSLPESVSVEEYQAMLEKLLPILQEKDIIWNYAAHAPRKVRIQDDIRRFLLCCDAILSGSKKPRFVEAGVTSGNFVGKAGRYILYKQD